MSEATKQHLLTAPEDIDGESLLEWQRICDEFARAGHPLAAEDRPILTLYVESWAVYRQAIQIVKKDGPVATFKNGMAGKSIACKVAEHWAAKSRKFLIDLGATPASRAKKSVAEPGELEI